MPRPPYKRAKLNHPTPSKRVAQPAYVPPLVELEQKLADKPVGRVLTDSDDSDKLVTSNKSGRNRRGIPRRNVYASGGVGAEDIPGAHRSHTQNPQAGRRPETQKSAGTQKHVAANKQPKAAGVLAKPAASSHKPVIQSSQKAKLPTPASLAPLGSISVNRAPTGLQPTPGPETSLLGNIKPRRRQPSILQQLENDDSSHIGEEDEDDFLPNDESTPLNHFALQPTVSTPKSSSSLELSSRKRKLNPPIKLVSASKADSRRPKVENGRYAPATDDDSEPELPPSRSVTAAQKVTPKRHDPGVMAPPLSSSSPLKSPAKPAPVPHVKKPPCNSTKQATAPSTNELRALLPARRQRRGRLRTAPLDQFDIPADADAEAEGGTSPMAASEVTDLSFGAKARGRKNAPITKTKAKRARKPDSARLEGRERSGRDKRTLSPIKLVTPLNRPAAAAKSSLSQQQQRHSHGPTGSHQRGAFPMDSYSSHRHDTSADKENRLVVLSGGFSGEGAAAVAEGPDREDDWLEQSIEEPTKTKTEMQPSKELQQMAQKFADVDEWEMEFEDVSLGGDSSPNRR